MPADEAECDALLADRMADPHHRHYRLSGYHDRRARASSGGCRQRVGQKPTSVRLRHWQPHPPRAGAGSQLTEVNLGNFVLVFFLGVGPQ